MAYKDERERRRENWEKDQWEKSHNMPEVRRRRKILFIIATIILIFIFFLSLANPVTWVVLIVSLLLPIFSGRDS